MRITEIDLEIEDIEWYGIDEDGRIAQFTSGGSKVVPEFICESRERLHTVSKFFEDMNPNTEKEVTFHVKASKNRSEKYLQECKIVSQKGLYCFDISDEQDTEEYVLICNPSCTLMISDLPVSMQDILLKCKISNSNFSKNNTILIEGSY
ncbi:hypothetical protein [Sinanaerobacter sp. ZZT-01]|uniref:hypothetical protein n=1 Tax=Sinanaerobacter sp. ZZT-01 TaxID=3111540 RepID=UPI002D76D891|nr:hypothetical protein [Sinanaerobacter sp. ZZT-01]WRR92366.1 hypothetical protein U5921_09855 [Sinanaerobacter sp. ZZT-01]